MRGKQYTLMLFLFWINFSFGEPFVSLKRATITVEKVVETKNSFIAYIKVNGKEFIVKQKKNERKLIAAVRDALAAYIARILNIAHQVDIISVKEDVPGKAKKEWPATIHTIAPGDIIRKQRDTPYSKLCLKQFWAQAESFDQTGLTKRIINHITWHEQLPVIVALDLVIGNSDRHGGNLCYDPVTDTFCAIDMDDTFNKDLCEVAHEKLVGMIKDPDIIFSNEEIEALLSLRNTINRLTHHFKPDFVIRKMHHFAKKAGFYSGSSLYTYSIKKKLTHYALMINATWKSSKRLVSTLDSIIASNKKKVALLKLKLNKGRE